MVHKNLDSKLEIVCFGCLLFRVSVGDHWSELAIALDFVLELASSSLAFSKLVSVYQFRVAQNVTLDQPQERFFNFRSCETFLDP